MRFKKKKIHSNVSIIRGLDFFCEWKTKRNMKKFWENLFHWDSQTLHSQVYSTLSIFKVHHPIWLDRHRNEPHSYGHSHRIHSQIFFFLVFKFILFAFNAALSLCSSSRDEHPTYWRRTISVKMNSIGSEASEFWWWFCSDDFSIFIIIWPTRNV